ncbi:MAG: glycosyltransferase family 4 protein [Myxococcota bacterium]
MLRISILSRRYSTRAGNERVAVELARQMLARGHQVDVWAHRIDGSAEVPGVRVRSVLGIGFDPTLAMLSYAAASERVVARLRKKQETDVVIGFGHSVIQDVYRLGGGTHAEFMELSRRRRGIRGGKILDRLALRLEAERLRPSRSPLLIAPSARVEDELVRHYQVDRARVRVIPNGIDLGRFQPTIPEGEREAVRQRWGVGPDAKVALFVGQDPERKGLIEAAEVARRLKLRLVWVGRDALPPKLAVEPIVEGPRADLESCYRAADLLLAPSWYDPFGGAVLEALACGLLPVATRRIGATERMLGTPLESLLVEEPDDLQALSAAAERALDPQFRPDFQAIARSVTLDASRERWGEAMERVLIEAAEARADQRRAAP